MKEIKVFQESVMLREANDKIEEEKQALIKENQTIMGEKAKVMKEEEKIQAELTRAKVSHIEVSARRERLRGEERYEERN